VTDSEGKYQFDSLDAGRRARYVVSVTADSFLPEFHAGVKINDGETLQVDFQLVSLGPPDTTTDTTTPPPLPPPGTFTGTVSDSAGTTLIAGALVVLHETSGRTGSVIDSATTDASGNYTFANVPALEKAGYTISVSASGFQPQISTRLNLDSGTVDTVNFNLLPMDSASSWILMGSVVSATDSTALLGVSVNVLQQFGRENRFGGTTDSAGNFSILIPNRPGSFLLVAALSGMLRLDSLITVTADSTKINLVMETDTNPTALGFSKQALFSQEIKAGPNPANTLLKVDLSSSRWAGREAGNLSLFDVSGKIRFQSRVNRKEKNQLISVGHFPNGIYLLVLKTGPGKVTAKKVLVQH